MRTLSGSMGENPSFDRVSVLYRRKPLPSVIVRPGSSVESARNAANSSLLAGTFFVSDVDERKRPDQRVR
jgi:hypothetical protein